MQGGVTPNFLDFLNRSIGNQFGNKKISSYNPSFKMLAWAYYVVLCAQLQKKIKVMKHGRFLLNLRVFGSKPIKTRPKNFLQENLSKMLNLENLLIYL